MVPLVHTPSQSFERFLAGHLEDTRFAFSRQLRAPSDDPEQIYLLHISGRVHECQQWLFEHVSGKARHVAVCADLPELREMLECVRLGARAYCNSHMAAIHYRQMLRLLAAGQSWFPPRMLEQTFDLARQAASAVESRRQLPMLTGRERDIALAVAEGKSNRQIADHYEISEPTVKSHLTNIFRKLELKDRVGLVLYLKQS